MKHLVSVATLTLLVAGLSTIGAPQNQSRAQEQKTEPKNLYETIVETKEYPTFLELVQTAGMTQMLKDVSKYTVFVPSEEAFKAVPEETMMRWKENPDLLRNIVQYHIVAGTKNSQDLKSMDMQTMDTVLRNHKLRITLDLEGVTMINEAKVTRSDIMAKNGMVHSIDKVLIPVPEVR